jgi:hypothetical protein
LLATEGSGLLPRATSALRTDVGVDCGSRLAGVIASAGAETGVETDTGETAAAVGSFLLLTTMTATPAATTAPTMKAISIFMFIALEPLLQS